MRGARESEEAESGPEMDPPELQNKGWERAWLPAELPGGWGWSRAGGAPAQVSGAKQGSAVQRQTGSDLVAGKQTGVLVGELSVPVGTGAGHGLEACAGCRPLRSVSCSALLVL